MRKAPVLYPFLFVAMVVLAAIPHQIIYVQLNEAIRPIVALWAVTAATLGVLWAILRDVHRAGVVGLYLMAVGLFFERIFWMLNGRISPITHNVLGVMIAGVVLLLAILALVLRRLGDRVRMATNPLNVIMVAVLAVTIYQVADAQITLRKRWDLPAMREPTRTANPLTPTTTPDIYYIILDAYPRADVFEELYGASNAEFLDFLRARGFQVIDDAHSNYGQTNLSLPSSLNMTYLDALPGALAEAPPDRTPLERLIRHNVLVELLRDAGYRLVAFESGYKLTELDNADVYMASRNPYMSTLERPLFSDSALATWVRCVPGGHAWFLEATHANHRACVEYVLSELPSAAHLQGPKFVFAHVIAPHPPFVLGPNGEKTTPERIYQLGDGSDFQGTHEEYIEGIRAQTTYVSKRMMEAVEGILSNSEEPPIIIIQSDHGPGSRLSWEAVEDTDTWERLSILNAYLLPGCEGCVYDTITPVNTFRMVLNEYLGASLPLLPDKSYITTWRAPFDFVPAFVDEHP